MNTLQTSSICSNEQLSASETEAQTFTLCYVMLFVER